jgi:hypothetical protein
MTGVEQAIAIASAKKAAEAAALDIYTNTKANDRTICNGRINP